MRRVILFAVFLSATVLFAAALEPLDIKPGLWQVTMTATVTGLPRPNVNTYQSCIRKEDLGKYPFTNPKDKCVWTVQTSTGSKMEATGTCMPEGMGKVDFSMNLQALDSENVKGTGQLTVNGGPGGVMNGNYSGTAKWVGATCPTGMK